MRNYFVLLVFLVLVIILPEAKSWEYEEIPCGTIEQLQTTLDKVDTLRSVTLFTASTTARTDFADWCLMKTWMYRIWDTTLAYSLPHHFATSSYGKFKMTGDTYPVGDTAFLTDVSWYGQAAHDTLVRNYALSILLRADSVIDFGSYDVSGPMGSPDGTVDYVVFVILNWSQTGGRAYPGGINYVTGDTNSLGDTVRVISNKTSFIQVFGEKYTGLYDTCAAESSCVYTSGRPRFYSIFIHETNHHFPQWSDWQYRTPGFDAESGFSRYAEDNSSNSPYCPYWRENMQWALPDSIVGPLYNVEIEDCNIADNEIVKLKSSVSNYQRFYATAHKRTVWEERYWPIPNDLAVLIWHSRNYAGSTPQTKKEDVEVPLGLYDFAIENCTDPGEVAIDVCNICDTNCSRYFEMLANSPNPISGYDSLDFRLATNPAGSVLYMWDGISYRNFDGTTNPSSDFYNPDSGINQNNKSHLAVRNITVNTQSREIYADLLVNNWYGELASSTAWGDTTQHTGYAITGDITVPAGQTLTIRRGTTVYFQKREDNQNGGAADTLCEIIVYGNLVAEGTASDSILFVPSSEQLGAAQSQDWYGIRFMPGSAGSLRYCAIRDGVIGVELEDTSEVEIAHCQIKSHGISGIDAYKCELQVDSSTIIDNSNYGIYSYKTNSLSVDSCFFRNNKEYALYCWYDMPDSTIVTNCQIDHGGSGIDAGSQYGIYAGIDKMRISKCTIKEYGQGAIKLDNSNCRIDSSDFRGNGTYGVYAISYSGSKIRKCNFSSLTIGLKAASYSNPDLGKVSITSDSGMSDFENCSSYYIRNEWPSYPQQTLYAEANYFGRYGPQASKFYGNVDYTPYLTYDPFPRLSIDPDILVQFALNPNYPNPFNPSTTISFSLDIPGPAIVSIYNLLGQRVKTLVDDNLSAGNHALIWNGENDAGEVVGSGVYFYTIQTTQHFESKKMILIR